jgi:hypothetical protein
VTFSDTANLEIEAMMDHEVLAEIEQLELTFKEIDFVRLEGELQLRAACMGWTGDPLKQPPRSVLAAARKIKSGGAR